jgi:hypothetical protein
MDVTILNERILLVFFLTFQARDFELSVSTDLIREIIPKADRMNDMPTL